MLQGRGALPLVLRDLPRTRRQLALVQRAAGRLPLHHAPHNPCSTFLGSNRLHRRPGRPQLALVQRGVVRVAQGLLCVRRYHAITQHKEILPRSTSG